MWEVRVVSVWVQQSTFLSQVWSWDRNLLQTSWTKLERNFQNPYRSCSSLNTSRNRSTISLYVSYESSSVLLICVSDSCSSGFGWYLTGNLYMVHRTIARFMDGSRYLSERNLGNGVLGLLTPLALKLIFLVVIVLLTLLSLASCSHCRPWSTASVFSL